MAGFVSTTPWWVWIILVYLVFIGMQATRNRLIYPPKLWIMPGIFLILRYLTLEEISKFSLFIDFTTLIIGFWSGFLIASQTPIKVFKENQSIEIPGSCKTLILLMLMFICKYILGYQKAVHPATAERYLILERLINNLIAGYFLGQVASYTYKYKLSIKKLK